MKKIFVQGPRAALLPLMLVAWQVPCALANPPQAAADPNAAAQEYYGYPAQQPYYAEPSYYYDPGYAQVYPQQGYDQGYYGYPQPAYPPQGYEQGYMQPGYGYGPQGDVDPYYAQPAYPQMPMSPYGYPSSPYGYGMPSMPQNVPFNNMNPDEIFGGDSPFLDPTDNDGYWAAPSFNPWNSGPLERDDWTDNHPMANMPWGRFPGWGDGAFGGFGPDGWKGVTPWGNDVPFKWINPTDPRDSIGEIWDDALNTPNAMGRMPPGWTAPYISVPNPVEVEEEFERNARKFPDEMRDMINTGESDWGGNVDPDRQGNGQQGEGSGRPRQFIEPVQPVEPVYPPRGGASR